MDKPKKIVVVGSSNTDLVVKSTALPKPGETVLGGEFQKVAGGKGANQAVVAARLGAEVTFVAKLGSDLFGKDALAGLKTQGLDTRYISIDAQNASGVALIMVDEKGENCISVASGTNALLSADDIDQANPAFAQAACLLVQLETPMPTVAHAITLASAQGCKVILNPAPAASIPSHVLAQVDWITPNETEAEILTGIKVEDLPTAQAAAKSLIERGVGAVIITMGAAGAYVAAPGYQGMVATKKVKAVDTTAAGDTFNGALAVALARDMPVAQAVAYANAAAAYSVTQFGAQSSAPSPENLLFANP